MCKLGHSPFMNFGTGNFVIVVGMLGPRCVTSCMESFRSLRNICVIGFSRFVLLFVCLFV